jgi:tetratricopeptide (TPR) repeat protein
LDRLHKTVNIEEQRIELLLILGEATYRAGRISRSLTVFQQAANIARKHGLREELARAAVGYENSRWRFNLPPKPANLLLEEAWAYLGPEETFLKVRVWIHLIRTRMAISLPKLPADMMNQVLSTARRINDPVSLFEALRLFVHSDRRPEKSAERMTMLQELRQLAQTLGNQEHLYEIYGFRLQEFMEIGDTVAFEQERKISMRLAEKLRQPASTYFLSHYEVVLAILAGDFVRAEKHAQDALALGHQTGVESADGVYSLQIFSIRREQGRLPELAPLIRLLAGQEATTNTWQPGLALIFSELNMRVEAQQAFENLAANDFSALTQDALWITSMTYLAEVCTYLGDAARAAVLYQQLLSYNGRAIVVGYHTICYGAAARYLGMLATTRQRWAEAERHFIDALEMNTRMSAYPWLAHTQHQYALMLLTRNEKDDKNKAISLLKEASATVQKLGMKALTEKIHRIGLDQIPGNV